MGDRRATSLLDDVYYTMTFQGRIAAYVVYFILSLSLVRDPSTKRRKGVAMKIRCYRGSGVSPTCQCLGRLDSNQGDDHYLGIRS